MSEIQFYPYSQLPRSLGTPASSGTIRSTPEDFRVDEILGFSPDGEGEHVLLHIEKRNCNTAWLAGELARFAGVAPRDVSYAGLKDRNAVTTQWFSLRLAGQAEPDWRQFKSEQVSLLEWQRHRRKLRRGSLRGNRFRILIRELQGDRDALEQRLITIKQQGVPNYFGEQRFGHQENNLAMAERLFVGSLKKPGRTERGLYISAARSYLFNQLLASRVTRGNWNHPLPGDLMMLDGRRSYFLAEEIDDELTRRTAALEIHPSGPLHGRGGRESTMGVAELEQSILQPYATWREGLEGYGLEQERRALRLRVEELTWSWPDSDSLELVFTLTKGSYATVVLRELIDYQSLIKQH
jgi:tRNA pseudouridine13 synthase